MYVNVPPRFACPRYFSRGVARVVETRIVVSWADGHCVRVVTGDAGFHWDIDLSPSPTTRLLNGVASLVPDAFLRSRPVLGLMGHIAGPILRAGRLRLHGRAPNGHRFIASPRLLWIVDDCSALVEGHDIGRPAPLDRQARLGDFLIPQRGILAFGQGVFDPETENAPVAPSAVTAT